MAIYRGTTKIAGVGKGFTPENTGNTGDKLEKTNTGYKWVKGELVEITEGGDDYSAMRGPCSEGFHIPSKDEWLNILEIGGTLGIWDTYYNGTSSTYMDNLKLYLKLPLPGRLVTSTGALDSSGSYGMYATVTPYGSNNLMSTRFVISGSNYIINIDGTNRVYGLPIRPFKDTSVVPDGTWTALYSDKIYHNSTLGLISLSSDGTNWTTIADKNLGATTVYNSGDALSEANCGKFYQWGNNYGFPYTGAVTTSSTKVDASGYGPGNYYSSSTFITVSSSPYNWSSVQNDNLRGGVTGVTIKGSEVTAGNILIYKTIQVKLLSDGWSSNQQTVRASGVTATNTVIISPDPSSFGDYTGATIYCSAQSTNSLTFTCDSEPSNNITVNIAILL